MVLEKKQTAKKFSTAKAILAVMWHLKETGRENLFSHKYIKLLCDKKHKNTHRSSLFRLCKSNFLKKDYNDIFILTDKGQGHALSAFLEVEAVLYKKEGQSWDGGWRIVFFDFPEVKRKYRDYLRRILKILGFYEFQRSIWIYPYPVPPFLKNFIYHNSIKPHIRFVTTNSIDNDRDLRIIFGLIGTRDKRVKPFQFSTTVK